MKKVLLTGLLFLGVWAPSFAGSYIEGIGGLANDSFGVRFGKVFSRIDLSGGYSKTGIDEVDLHTLNVEADPYFRIFNFTVKGILGAGFTIPNYLSGPTKADNDVSYTLGVASELQMTSHWAIGLGLKSLFFRSDTHNQYFTSHEETLSTGQTVIISDENHYNDSRSFNTTRVFLNLKYLF